MLQGKKITVTVPKTPVVRVKKYIKDGPKLKPKQVWLIDFRGIRADNKVVKNRQKKQYRGEKAAFNSPEQLQMVVDEYFNSCYSYMYDKNGNLKYDKNGEPIKYQSRPFTVSGLALAIGVSTKTLNRYCTGNFDAEFEDDPRVKTYKQILVKAKQKIESFAESRLYDKEGQLGARFVLDSSFGWCTQKEQAEIQEKQFNMWLKEQEFDLKQKLANMGENTDGLEIRIVRKGE